MAFRRPRVKAAANLVSKRGSKGGNNRDSVNEKKPEKTEEENVSSETFAEKTTTVKEEVTKEIPTEVKNEQKQSKNSTKIKSKRIPSPLPDVPKETTNEISRELEITPDVDEVFKAPDPLPFIGKFDGGLEGTEKEIPIGSLSPTKSRQRIKPTPFFFRRNSTHESDDEVRRQKVPESPTTSTPQSLQAPRTPLPGFMGQRIRTESTSSAMSDVSMARDRQSRPFTRPGEMSKTADLRKDLSHRLASGRYADRSRLTMYDMIYYNPTSNPMKSPARKGRSKTISERRSSTSSVLSVASVNSLASHKTEKEEPESPEHVKIKVEDATVKEEPAMPVPQLKLGPNGEMILDEKSLVIETTGDREARKTLANASIVYDDEFSSSNGFYKRQTRTREWTDQETVIFYRCLHTVGTDFSMMCTLFTNRTRRDLKLKFKKEEKVNLHLVNKALMFPKTFNLEELRQELAKNAEDAEKAIKAEKEATMKEIKKERKTVRKTTLTAKKPTIRNVSRTQRQFADGDYAYKMEEILSRPKAKRKRKIISSDEEEDQEGKPAKLDSVQKEVDEAAPPDEVQEVLNMVGDIGDVKHVKAPEVEEEIEEYTEEPCQQYEEEMVEEDLIPYCESDPIETVEEDFEDVQQADEDLEYAEDEVEGSEYSEASTDLQNLDLNNLVIVEEEKDGEIDYKIHLKNPKTDEISEKPLDLPPEVIQCIVSAHMSNQS
ncbi:transcription factor TFIIIB component B'' [Sergentomyia squamirostris]